MHGHEALVWYYRYFSFMNSVSFCSFCVEFDILKKDEKYTDLRASRRVFLFKSNFITLYMEVIGIVLNIGVCVCVCVCVCARARAPACVQLRMCPCVCVCVKKASHTVIISTRAANTAQLISGRLVCLTCLFAETWL